MRVEEQINHYLNSLPEAKRADMVQLDQLMRRILPASKVWFDSGINEENKIINNPTIGYGHYTIQYANGTSKEVFQIGLSGNSTGISIYILGIKDKTYLAQTFGEKIGKAKVTGYCVRFKACKDINLDILEAMVRSGVEQSNRN